MQVFKRSNFYTIKGIKINKFIDIHKKKILSSFVHNDFLIENLSSDKILFENSILFLKKNNIDNLDKLINKKILIITDIIKYFEALKSKCSVILVLSIEEVYKTLLDTIFISDDHSGFQDKYDLINGSYISIYSKIDNTAKVYPGSVIGKGCEIGKNTIIKQNCSIKYSIIGNDTIINENSSIGSTGFGFPVNKGSNQLYPHLGYVYIGNNCSIGSNCTIDRAKVDVTMINDFTMLDNLIHVGHNVVINKYTTIAAQTGISGSVYIDERVTIGGQVGLTGHINIGKDSIIAAKSGVTKSIKNKSTVAGFPAIDIKKWKKMVVKLKTWT